MRLVECNKCGKHFEVEGEWGYCPFCENDNVEVKKNLEDLIDEDYDNLHYKKESMALAYHSDSSFYFQYPDAYEYDLEKEVERLNDELELIEKALELSVGELDDAKDMLRECGKNDWAGMLDTSVDYFKSRAKEMVNNE